MERFLEAEIVTNYPYLEGDGLQGTVYFERASIDGSTKQLKYVEYKKFYEMKNSGNSDLYNCFTIDTDDWTVHVGRNKNQEGFEIEKIDYKNMVSKFSMPFEFTIDLAMITQNPQFALAVVNLVKNSKIVITIAESQTITETEVTKRYHQKIESKEDGSDEDFVVISEGDVSEQPTVDTVTSYSTSVFLSRANTWILNQVTEMKYDNSTSQSEPIVTNLDDEISTTNNQGVSTRISKTNVTDTAVITNHYKRWNTGKTEVIEKTKNFTNLIIRDNTFINGNGLVEIAKRCHDYLVQNGYTYETPGGHHFPYSGDSKTIDCSAYVSWVLKEAGYDIDCLSSRNSSLGAFGKSLGWEIIKDANQLEAGDICFYRGDIDGNDPGHVNICVGKEEDKYLFYDCGCTSYVQASDPVAYNMSEFGYAFRPNDDIARKLSASNISDLKSKLEDYIEGLSKAKYSVSVKNLDKDKETFTINNKKVKSEGFLKIYIMATVYDEIKKGNIQEEDVKSDIERMIVANDNNAANSLLRKLGEELTNESTNNEESANEQQEEMSNEAIEKGIRKVDTFISNNLYTGVNIEEMLSPDAGAAGSDKNYAKVSSVTNIMKDIYKGKCVNQIYSEKMMNILKSQLLTDMIPATIESGQVANKTGEQIDILQDSAIVSIENANYILTITASEVENKTEAANQIREISNQVYGYFLRNGTARNNIDEESEIDYIMDGRKVCYKVERMGYVCPIYNLEEGSDMLFKLLAENEKTQNHERLMRYLMYLLTGNDYGVKEFDFNEFLNGSFYGAGGAWCAIWGNACTREEFIAAVRAFNPPNVTGNGGRSCVQCYNRYFVANAENFYDICTRNGMDPRFIFCIGIHESYYGTSNIANTKGNFFGWGAYDWDPMGGALHFADMSQGIDEVSKGLKKYVTPGTWQYNAIKAKGYDPTTIEGIGSLYASDPNWANAVKQHMTKIFGCTGETSDPANASNMQKKIVQIAKGGSLLGNRGGYCQAWVADVYARAGQSPRQSRCCATGAWNSWKVSTSKDNIPIGACVYGYSSRGSGGGCHSNYGHVAIYIGDGQTMGNEGGSAPRQRSLDNWISIYGWKGWGWNGGTDYSK